ncbi:hypothetical protein BASA50_007745 [Batrachochytrium salamandrivorans]|uniref:Palmitoyl-protein thioesterase 1 n=1 Tax=Batrachochytrium salamandrivorans TaxID=1357716 RepID=A0ABQ8F650_9FUNG|nr:hypothetical protein BASA50_007745 [Batrachochytrium salamandrivorans]KAJ1336608.1 hypothetical protein BSLG_007390 [Batrachochytrium salamandrivorans]
MTKLLLLLLFRLSMPSAILAGGSVLHTPLSQSLPQVLPSSQQLLQPPLPQNEPLYRPIVFWHGMGDSCCNPESLGRLVATAQRILPGVFVHSVQLGSTLEQDKEASFFGVVNDQIQQACEQIQQIPELAHGFNAVGLSQGGLFLRAVAQQCDSVPQMHTLITFGSPHGGVSDVPNCIDSADASCVLMRSIIRTGVYWPWIQRKVVQAQYFKQYTHLDQYLEKSAFLADINNEREGATHSAYAHRIKRLDKLILVQFENDTMVVPKETAWFSYYNADGVLLPLQEQPVYTHDLLGLKALDLAGRLDFISLPGNHLHLPENTFEDLLSTYFSEDVSSLLDS